MTYKEYFIQFMVGQGALLFGDYTLKSGRHSPFYMNAGSYVTGDALIELGRYYAQAIHSAFGDDFDVLFGPSYKGIPLAVATSMSYWQLYNKHIRYCSNRKEIKDHGDKGALLGTALKSGDKVVMIEDVTTSGASIRETLPIVHATDKVEVIGLIVSLDRQEKAGEDGNITALEGLSRDLGIKTTSIVTMGEVIDFLYKRPIAGRVLIDDEVKSRLVDYYAKWGVGRGI